MEDLEARNLAKQLMIFHMKFLQWNISHYNKEFNINGKSKYPLTARQYSLLFLIDTMEGLTVSDIERVMDLSKSSISITLAKLVDEGFIEKKQEGRDRRRVNLGLTGKGKKELISVNERIEDMFYNSFHTLTQEKRRDLAIGIEKMTNVFKEDGHEKGK